MKKNEFVAIIRKLIREEVRSQVKPLVMEEMNNQMSRLLGEVIRGGMPRGSSPVATTQPRPQPINEQVAPVPAPGRKHTFTKTGNPALDELLSKTIGDIPQEPLPIGEIGGDSDVMSELRRIGDTEKINFREMFQPKPEEVVIDRSSNLNMLKSIVGAGSNMNTPSALDVPDEINPIAGALKKDYRTMMKDMDGIKSRMRSGPMAMPTIDPNEWRRLDAEDK